MDKIEASFSKSIFAYELHVLLSSHNLTLSDLKRSPISLDHKKVDGLIASLSGVKRLPALNQEEIASIIILLKLTEDEQLRIHAALIALGVQRLLFAHYLSPHRVWEIANEVREASFAWLRQKRKIGIDPFRRIHGYEQEEILEQDNPSEPLLQALNVYDEGTALMTLGQLSVDSDAGRVLLEQANLCFMRAIKLLEDLPSSLHTTDDWPYWYSEVESALKSVQNELE